ncbi:MAG: deoxyuridine 5'-triphosphate nucleotidohydrolase [Candidatus Omnitrophica bacterium]|jgi:dUTP pyrophosphatase|nr:deoxyuridine 5'-triphosphate nucleotidohydrolase [Candidatus Omnitrophota bacterium]
MLNREEIKRLITKQELVSGYIDLDTQLTPNGIDLTAAQIHEFEGAGRLDFSNKERVLPQYRQMRPEKIKSADKFGWWHLERGAYKIVTNESVCLPRDLIGVAFPRSSLLRMGIFTQTGVWDAGFKGKSEFILIVENPLGADIKQNARVVQLMFTKITETETGYNGVYQNK